ncbi:MAG: hypothetical protein ACYC0V_18480 [Armatimonadota bacterium]
MKCVSLFSKPTDGTGGSIMEPYISPIQFNEEPAHVIVICCSDGRTRQQIFDFLDHHGISADIYAVPGGPLIFSGGVEMFQDAILAERRMKYLIDEHATQKIILIGHGSEDELCQCGMAKMLFPDLSPADRLSKQKALLITALDKVAGITGLPVEAYFANVVDDMVQFEMVE